MGLENRLGPGIYISKSLSLISVYFNKKDEAGVRRRTKKALDWAYKFFEAGASHVGIKEIRGDSSKIEDILNKEVEGLKKRICELGVRERAGGLRAYLFSSIGLGSAGLLSYLTGSPNNLFALSIGFIGGGLTYLISQGADKVRFDELTKRLKFYENNLKVAKNGESIQLSKTPDIPEELTALDLLSYYSFAGAFASIFYFGRIYLPVFIPLLSFSLIHSAVVTKVRNSNDKNKNEKEIIKTGKFK